jgi:hypothetical protein
MKTCPTCGVLALTEFNFKNRALGRRQLYCRACSRAYVRDHYARNRQYYIDKAQARNPVERHALRQQVLSYVAVHPCVDCGESDSAVLDFDHIDPTHKQAPIGDMLARQMSWSRILAEVQKCVVRCANCHRRRTAQQFGWYKRSAEVGQPCARSSIG